MSMIKSLSLLSLSLSQLGKQQRDEARTVHNLHTRKLGTNIAEVSSCIMKIIYDGVGKGIQDTGQCKKKKRRLK